MIKDKLEVKNRRVKDFLNNEVRDFAKYVIETRSCPNIMDGMRTGARKCLWAAMTGDMKNSNKAIKMPALIGDALKLEYKHNPNSLMNTIVGLASDYIFRYKPFEVIGQIGDIRQTKSDTAPRYLHVKKSEYIDLFTVDKELLEQDFDDGKKIEPKYFLPIVPVVLMYRTNSPGFGVSFRSFSYTLDSIIDNCINVLNIGTCQEEEFQLIPDICGVKVENLVYNSNKDCWYSVGEYRIDEDSNTLTVTDLPYSVQLHKYEEHLENLIERGTITKYSNLSMDGDIRYVITFPYGRLRLLYNENRWKFFQTFKLFSKVPKDILNCIDIDGKTILSFDSAYQLIDFFVKRRLKFYTDRKTLTIKSLKEQIARNEYMIKFISLVNDGTLVVSRRPISDIQKDLDFHELPYDVLKLRIEKLTKEEIEKLQKETKELKDYLNYIEKTSEKTMYLNDLIELKTKYCEINKLK